MEITALCYVEHDNKYLMLNRNKKKNDLNGGKWIGLGGHFEEGESPYDCVRREVYEESGIKPQSLSFRGIVTFVSDEAPTEYMHLFTAKTNTSYFSDCDEGTLMWVDKNKVTSLPIWEGDRVFLELITKDVPFFSLKLVYAKGKLVSHILDD